MIKPPQYDRDKIGIAITTRNRSSMLEILLKHLKEYSDDELFHRCIFVDDNSDNRERQQNIRLLFSHGVRASNIILSKRRLGIARAKNVCLAAMGDVDHYFLLDDDVFPIRDGWCDLYIHISNLTKCEHLLYNEQVSPYEVIYTRHGLDAYNVPLGVFLHATKNMIQTVGGFVEEFGYYGMEHVHYTNRMYHANATKLPYMYCVPTLAPEFIFAMDVSHRLVGRQPILVSYKDKFESTVIGKERDICSAKASDVYLKKINDTSYVPIKSLMEQPVEIMSEQKRFSVNLPHTIDAFNTTG